MLGTNDRRRRIDQETCDEQMEDEGAGETEHTAG